MYLSFYNLKIKPFQMNTDPKFLWLGEKHKEALAVLKYAIMENKGVLALTGDVGTGKTTLINALLTSLGGDTITATIYDARLDVLDFFNTVAAAFKMNRKFDGKGQFIIQFMEFLMKAHERHQKVLLIIDEAQGINSNLLEEIRLLSNLEAEYTRMLNIFFVGQNEFIDILQKYENRALRQRVTIRYHIDPLTLNETAAYIWHRLEVSGCKEPIFESGAIDEIYFFSGGYPRLINIMCDHALLTGYVREIKTINAKHIRECREELLVSKKSSGEVFEYPPGNQQVLPEEPVVPEPSREPVVPEPSREPVSSEPSRQPFVYVRDPRLPEDEQGVIGSRYSTYRLASHQKIQKKGIFRFSSILIFLLVVGIVYFFYGNNSNKTKSFVVKNQQQIKNDFSINAKSKNDSPSITQDRPEASDIPKQVQSGNAGAASFSKTSDESESVGNTPEMKADKSGPLNGIPKALLNAESLKEPASDQTPAKTPPNLPLVAIAPLNPPEKAPAAVPAPTIKKGNVRMTAAESAPVRETPTNEKSAEKQISKSMEKPETAESITPHVQKRNKTKESEALIRAGSKKEPAAASSVSSEKQTAALFEKFRKTLSKKTVVSEAGRPAEPPLTIKEKAPAAFSVSNQKKPVNQAVEETDKKVASLGNSTSKSENAGKADLPYIALTTRLESFLKQYCRTYEQKNLDKFSTFFAFNAVEKGKPFTSWLPKYRQNFKKIDSMEYNIELNRYATQEETGLIKIDGTFHIRAKLEGSKDWVKNSGELSMILQTDGNSFKVIELDY